MVTELAVIPLVPPPGLAGADPAALDEGDEPAGAAVVDDELADFELLPHPAAMKPKRRRPPQLPGSGSDVSP